jgi:hypothetical protein
MFSLARKQFPDLLLTPEDLDALADLWLAWHEQARLKSFRRLESYHAIQLQLWGFPRQDREMLRQRLQQNLNSMEVLDFQIDDSDPEWLTVKTPFLDFSQPPSLARWHALVDAAPFHGLVALLRLSLHDWPAAPVGPAERGGTLVICGHLRRDGLLLKALWPEGLERGIEGLYRNAAWPQEAKLLRDLDEYRRTSNIAPPPKDLFASRSQERRRTRAVRLVVRLPEQGRLPSFLLRVGYHLAVLSLFGLFYWMLQPLFPLNLAICLTGGAFSLFALGYVLRSEIKRVWTLHKLVNAGLRKAFAQPLQLPEVNLAEEGALDDPNIVKYSREVEAQGASHMADVRLDPGPSGTFYNRIFALPAERIYLLLNVMTAVPNVRLFPAKPLYLLVTYLSDGRVVTIGEGGGFRKRLKKDVFIRHFPETYDPGTLLAKHRKFLAEVCAQGHTLAPFPGLREFLERMSQEHTETRELYERHGYYPWSAAIRQSFGLVRREYLEPSGARPAPSERTGHVE